MILDYPRQNGQTKRQSQAQVKKTLGRKPKGWVEDKQVPAYGAHFWSTFWELDGARTAMEPITYTEINAYKAAVGVFLRPMDIRCIKAMDNARIATTAKVSKENG